MSEDVFAADVRRLVEIQDAVKQLETEADAIKARIRQHGPGKVGDLTVNVSTARRFSPVKALEVLTPEQLASCTETTISTAKARQVLPPAVYEACMYPYGDARVVVR